MYDYKVWRNDNGIFYQISRAGENIIEPRSVRPEDLSFITFMRTHGSAEKQNAGFLKKAHELAKFAIKNLIEHEKL